GRITIHRPRSVTSRCAMSRFQNRCRITSRRSSDGPPWSGQRGPNTIRLLPSWSYAAGGEPCAPSLFDDDGVPLPFIGEICLAQNQFECFIPRHVLDVEGDLRFQRRWILNVAVH